MTHEYLKPDRVILLVMDGCGIGAAPDAELFGDDPNFPGSTLSHVASAAGGLKISTLRVLGLGNVIPISGGDPHPRPIGSYGKLAPHSQGGKDTVTGHWEMMGIIVPERFPTYPNGFPHELVNKISQSIGVQFLGNKPASGTEIIKEFGEEHRKTGKPILYTSADSVFQIAAHEEVIPIEKLYEICTKSRTLLKPPDAVQRVIARPFRGESRDEFYRTEKRKDFPLTPPQNVLDELIQCGVKTYGIGVVPEAFGGRGFTYSKRTQSNLEHYQGVLESLESDADFIFANFEDFDMLWGHRNDAEGFAEGLEIFDGYLKRIMGDLDSRDLLIITADHGNDPTTPGTDHSREYAPLLMYAPSLSGGINLGVRETYADIGATLRQVFDLDMPKVGKSFL